MIKLFMDDALKLIEEFGAENAIARLLAYVSGYTQKMKSRSLLCGAEGWVTYSIKWKNKFQHVGYVWGFFKRMLKEEIKSKIRGMRLFASMDGCVFDYPEEGHEIFEEILYNDRFYGTNYNLEKIEDLPELLNIDEQRFGGNNNIKENINKFNNVKNIEFDATIALDKETGKPRGFGFISVFNKDDVHSVLKLNGKEFFKRKLVINESKK